MRLNRSGLAVAADLLSESVTYADPLLWTTTGYKRTITADVEWTFPLEFVEVVWGDGVKTDRRIISATDLPAFGKHRFSIPFDATGKKWVRFAVWDSVGNGAIVQPVKLASGPAATTAPR